MVFDEHTMQERLPSATFKQLMRTIKDGEPLNLEAANVMARAGQASAQLRHFTHSVIERFPRSAYGSISSGHA